MKRERLKLPSIGRRGAGRPPVRLALGLALMASIAMGGPVAGADLSSLNANMETVATTGQSVYQQTGRMLVHLAGIDIADADLRSDAIATIRTVTQGARGISLRSQQFEQAFQASSARAAGSTRLDDALSRYGAASRALDEHSRQMLALLENIRLRQDLERKTAELRSFIDASRSYEDAQNEMTSALSELEDMLLPPTERDARPSAISLSVYGFADDRGAESSYGLYTHVLFPTEGDRNVALVEVLLRNPKEDVLADRHAAINLFALPVRDRLSAQLAARVEADAPDVIASRYHYDYPSANRLLAQFCLTAEEKQAEVCSGDWQGPFLLSYPRYLSSIEELSEPYLLVDLSAIHEAAFGEFVRAVKQQVMLPDYASREKIDTFRLQLLDITLEAADWILPLKEGIAGILSPVPERR